MSLKSIPVFTSIFVAFFLFSCSSVPSTMQVTPEISTGKNPPVIDSNNIWSLSSQDRRIARYLIEISAGDGPATLINEADSSHRIIMQTLNKEWQAQGLIISPGSEYKIDLQLIKILAKVKQSTYKHEINSEVVIKIQLNANNKVYNKTFNSNAISEAPLNANSKKISKQLNTQLSQLLTEIALDPEIKAKLENF
ncbi:YajG family lipoprotein [Psychromonas sp.]|uniref:YajG family lipoprotein n=1 Tax=Psychromonas sp. TaxID=1884585 RepID=UPI0035646D0D